MSLEASTLVWNHSSQKNTALLVMLAMANWANEDFVAYPSVEGIAKKVRCGTRNTNKIIAKLQEAGEITIIGHLPSGRNKYRITITPKDQPTTCGMPEDENVDPEPECRSEPQFRPSVDSDGEKGAVSSMDPALWFRSEPECRSEVEFSARSELGFPEVCTGVQTTLKKTKVNTKEYMHSLFEKFKKHYPNRGGLELDLAAAQDIFIQLVTDGEDAEAIIAAAKMYSAANANMKQAERKFIKNAKNFLKLGIWREYVPKAKASLAVELAPDTPAMWRDILENWPQQDAAKAWLYPLKVNLVTAQQVHLVAPTAFHKSRVMQDFYNPLLAKWKAAEPGITDFQIFVEGEVAA